VRLVANLEYDCRDAITATLRARPLDKIANAWQSRHVMSLLIILFATIREFKIYVKLHALLKVYQSCLVDHHFPNAETRAGTKGFSNLIDLRER
jgi:hypothetical protein